MKPVLCFNDADAPVVRVPNTFGDHLELQFEEGKVAYILWFTDGEHFDVPLCYDGEEGKWHYIEQQFGMSVNGIVAQIHAYLDMLRVVMNLDILL